MTRKASRLKSLLHGLLGALAFVLCLLTIIYLIITHSAPYTFLTDQIQSSGTLKHQHGPIQSIRLNLTEGGYHSSENSETGEVMATFTVGFEDSKEVIIYMEAVKQNAQWQLRSTHINGIASEL